MEDVREYTDVMVISKTEYEHLVRQSERIRILERMLSEIVLHFLKFQFRQALQA
jgi:hypothetical protein